MSKNIVAVIMLLFAIGLVSLAGCGGGGGNAPNNQTTVAKAGSTQSVVSGIDSVVALDGSQSTGADGNLITYQWTIVTKPVGSAATLTTPNDVNPTFTADLPGEYTLELTIKDGITTSTSTVVVTATGAGSNAAPVANAGTGQRVLTGTFVTLDGSASSDANPGDLLTFSWAFQSVPTGSSAVLSSAVAVRPTFIADLEGVYVVKLTVSDGKLTSDATVTVTASGDVLNVPPVANAGSAQSVTRGSVVTLNGSGTDAGGLPLTYSWSFTSKPAGSRAALSSATVAKPTFTADVAGAYVLNLVVSNDESNSAAVTVTITASAANAKPVAYAGFNRPFVTSADVTKNVVTLDGSASSDANGDALTYRWAFVAIPNGSGAALSSATAQKPTFTADKTGDFVIELIVNDGIVDSTAVRVTISAAPLDSIPVANAGVATRTVIAGATVALDGRLSFDADGSPVTYLWSLTRPTGSTAVLSSTTSVNPSFTADIAGVYSVTLIVRCTTANSAPVTVTITALAPYMELSRVAYYGDDILPLDYSSTNNVLTPASAAEALATFKLVAFGAGYTVSNLSATDPSGTVTPSFSGLTNGQTIASGNQAIFSLKSTSTHGASVNVSYSFTLTEAVTLTTKTFSYTATLTSN